VLGALTESVVSSLNGVRAAVHHGWDGERFVGVAGSWPGAASLPLDGRPWVDAVGHDGVLVVPADERAVSRWLVRVGGTDVPPAVLTVWTNVEGPPLFGHRGGLQAAARYVELAIIRTAEHQRLRHLAGHDSLTGVANRGAFRDRLAGALAIGDPGLAVAFCDLDGFKRLNDTRGHAAGDAVLVEVADRLRATLRTGDEVARMGGDEFTVLYRRLASADEAAVVGTRLVAAVEGAGVGMSVGIALARPGMTADDLLQAADAAVYASKRAGGGRCTVSR
jgi:diguanylate cyclase (GGDEF)-like protein